jgi:uncharacterized CHY-type Zn-finger protein
VRTLKDVSHLIRAAALLLGGLGVFLLLRGILVPPGFGTYGHFRPGALADNQGRPLHFAGRAACEECHTDVVAARQGSKHQRIGCEACHGPLAAHAADPAVDKPVLPDTTRICLVCHLAKVAVPSSFPQIDPKAHGEGAACTSCHKPHHPDV